MIYRNFKDEQLSLLGFGLMRLPLNEDKTIDQEQVAEMVKYAFERGINYFDTAWPYHDGRSEVVIGEILKNYPRESFYLADKFPGHQPMKNMDPEFIFNEQLRRCQVDYFDFYLLHNITEFSVDTFENEELGIIPYLVKMREEGKIKHLGFSSHGGLKNLEYFLDKYGDIMEFCQIQMNYLDWYLQDAKAKYEMLTERGIPVFVMEPLRGGKLKNQSEAFRWLERFDNVKMILSGMSMMDHMRENCAIFHSERPLSDLDTNGLKLEADKMMNNVPCTDCHYCDGCPKGIDIPYMMGLTNELRVEKQISIAMRYEALEEGKRPGDCIECGACIPKCPQKINIPEILKELEAGCQSMPRWTDICKVREKAQLGYVED